MRFSIFICVDVVRRHRSSMDAVRGIAQVVLLNKKVIDDDGKQIVKYINYMSLGFVSVESFSDAYYFFFMRLN